MFNLINTQFQDVRHITLDSLKQYHKKKKQEYCSRLRDITTKYDILNLDMILDILKIESKKDMLRTIGKI